MTGGLERLLGFIGLEFSGSGSNAEVLLHHCLATLPLGTYGNPSVRQYSRLKARAPPRPVSNRKVGEK